MEAEKLNMPANHKRSLSVTARKVEKTLDEIEAIINGDYNERLTERIIPIYTSEQKKEILDIVKLIRLENEKMFYELDLNPLELLEDRVIKAKSSYLWTILIDSTAKYLKGYGFVPKDVAKEVDSHINKLLSILDKLKNLDSV